MRIICDLLDCEDFHDALVAALITLGLGNSQFELLAPDNTTIQHISGDGTVTDVNICDDVLPNCLLFSVIDDQAIPNSEDFFATEVLQFRMIGSNEVVVTKAGSVCTVTLPPSYTSNVAVNTPNLGQYTHNDGDAVSTVIDTNGATAVFVPDAGVTLLSTVVDSAINELALTERPYSSTNIQISNQDGVLYNANIGHLGAVVEGGHASQLNPNALHTVMGNSTVNNNHTLNGSFANVSGSTNNAGNSCNVTGINNSGDDYSNIYGQNNSGGEGSSVGGRENQDLGEYNEINGRMVTILGNKNIGSGTNINITGNNSFSIGEAINQTANASISVGVSINNGGERTIAVGSALEVDFGLAGNAIFGRRGHIMDEGVFMWCGAQAAAPVLNSVQFGEFVSRTTGTRLYTSPAGLTIQSGVLIQSANNFFGTFLETSAGSSFTAAGQGLGTGAHLTSGGVFVSVCSEGLKSDRLDVSVLDKLQELDIGLWQSSINPQEWHITPTSESFSDLFGVEREVEYRTKSGKRKKKKERFLGLNNKTLSAMDVGGVAILSILELEERVRRLEDATS